MAVSSSLAYVLEHPWFLFLLPIGLLLSPFIYYLYDDYKIKKIGHRGVRVPERLPCGLDLMYRAIKATSEARDMQWYDWMFSYIPTTPTNTFDSGLGTKENINWFRDSAPTVEQNLGGRRFLFTADPENIKAILATQFSDFGKGELFHRDWKEFLGDGIFATVSLNLPPTRSSWWRALSFRQGLTNVVGFDATLSATLVRSEIEDQC